MLSYIFSLYFYLYPVSVLTSLGAGFYFMQYADRAQLREKTRYLAIKLRHILQQNAKTSFIFDENNKYNYLCKSLNKSFVLLLDSCHGFIEGISDQKPFYRTYQINDMSTQTEIEKVEKAERIERIEKVDKLEEPTEPKNKSNSREAKENKEVKSVFIKRNKPENSLNQFIENSGPVEKKVTKTVIKRKPK